MPVYDSRALRPNEWLEQNEQLLKDGWELLQNQNIETTQVIYVRKLWEENNDI